MNNGAFVISLDFELLWGVRDSRTKETYGANIMGARIAIPRMLAAFEAQGIRATWATVGFLFCGDKEELLASCPTIRPTYDREGLSNYSYFPEVGLNERSDPYYYGASLVKMIQETEGQEIATHSMSHFCCLEPGATTDQFCADLDAAVALAARYGSEIKSIVFPRNQYSSEYLAICRAKNLRTFRGNERVWFHKPASRASQTRLRRAARLADCYVNLGGRYLSEPSDVSGMVNLPASRFLRPYSRRLGALESARLNRIKASMTAAAETRSVFHLWWHPHNFGLNTGVNMGFLQLVLDHFAHMKDKYGMTSRAMGDFA